MSIVLKAANFAFGKDSWTTQKTNQLSKAQHDYKFPIGTLPAAFQTVTSAVAAVAAGIFFAFAFVGWVGAKLLRQIKTANALGEAAKITGGSAISHAFIAVYSAFNTATLSGLGKCVKKQQFPPEKA